MASLFLFPTRLLPTLFFGAAILVNCLVQQAFASAGGMISSGASSAESSASTALESFTELTGATSNSASSSSAAGAVARFRPEPVPAPTLAGPVCAPKELSLIFDRDIGEAYRSWLHEVILGCGRRFSFISGNTLRIRASGHPLLARRGEQARILGGALLVSSSLLESRNAPELELALGRAAWDLLDEEERRTWRIIGGWSRNPFFPFLESQKKCLGKTPADTAREEFALAITGLLPRREPATSRDAFIAQLCGQGAEPADLASLDAVNVGFVFVSQKGIGGASQGHCAIFLEKGDVRCVFAYSADFDWKRPLLSGIQALTGNSRRMLGAVQWGQFLKRYEGEGREVVLRGLDLSAEEKQRLLFRISECMRHEDGSYSFLRQNCAGPLRDLLVYVLPDERDGLRRWHTPRTLFAWAQSRRPCS